MVPSQDRCQTNMIIVIKSIPLPARPTRERIRVATCGGDVGCERGGESGLKYTSCVTDSLELIVPISSILVLVMNK